MSTENVLPRREQKVVQVLKQVVGAPIPLFLGLYVLALLTSMAGMEAFGWATSVFTLLYIIIDRFSRKPEFRFFATGVDIPLALLLIVVVCGLLVNPPSPEADLMFELGELRWIILFYLLTYSLSLFPNLNRLITMMMIAGTLIGAYGIFQHFSGIDLRFLWGLRPESAVTPAPHDPGVFQSVGLFSHHLTYGDSFSMLVCFPFAALLLGQRKSSLFRWACFLSVLIIGLSLLWTYGRGVWIATAAAFLLMTGYVSRKYVVFALLFLGVGIGLYYNFSPGFRERFDTIWSDNYRSNDDRRDLWKANIAMFQENPWVGVGYGRNEPRTQEYYAKLGIKNDFGGHAHNVYFQWLATTGLLGFSSYMLFILIMLLMTLRLWNEIPKTHYWHRVFVLGALGAQVAMHTGGLTQWNFGDAEVNHQFIFILALVAYMSHRYSRDIIPDDYAL